MAFSLKFADTTAFTTAIDDAALPDGIAVLIADGGDGSPVWFYLDQASTATAETGKVYATQSGTGRWIRVGGSGGGGGGGGGTMREAAPPDPTNAWGYSIHIEDKIDPERYILRVWDGAAWIDTKYSWAYQATSNAPTWLPDGDGQICVDTMSRGTWIAAYGAWEWRGIWDAIPYQP